MTEFDTTAPLRSVQQLFAAALAAHGGNAAAMPHEFGEAAHLQQLLATRPDFLDQIPLLNSTQLESVAANTLVRFRCMVQDTLDPEYYAFAQPFRCPTTGQTVLHTAKYSDVFHVGADWEAVSDERQQLVRGRQPLYCVAIPGESSWLHSRLSPSAPASASMVTMATGSDGAASAPVHRGKRSLDDTPTAMDQDAAGDESAVAAVPAGTRVRRPAEAQPSLPATSSPQPQPSAATTAATQPSLPSSSSSSTSAIAATADHKEGNLTRGPDLNVVHAHPSATAACIVKVYEEDESPFRLNMLIEVIGVLGMAEPALVMNDATRMDHDFRNVVHSVPYSAVPRIHCLVARPLDHLHGASLGNNLPTSLVSTAPASVPTPASFTAPASDCSVPTPAFAPSVPMAGSVPTVAPVPMPQLDVAAVAAEARPRLVAMLTSLLSGDHLSAEYLLLFLLSRVQGEAAGGTMKLGRMSLNLIAGTASPAHFGVCVHAAVSAIVPRSVLVPLSLDTLNSSVFFPRKDYELNRLVNGVLQLPAGTIVLLDEMQMQAGQLDEQGLSNMRAIQRFVVSGDVDYDFHFHHQTFQLDAPPLVLSSAKSMFPADFSVLVDPSHVHQPAPAMDEAVLELLRVYLSLARNCEATMSEQLSPVVETDFVSMRQADATVTSDSLHQLLLLSRLIAQSHGETTVTPKHWTAAKTMEHQRRTQLAAHRI